MQFRRGFGDGAKSSFMRFPQDSDYIRGYITGREAAHSAVNTYREAQGLIFEWDILRTE